MSNGFGLGTRPAGVGVPIAEQGLDWAAWDAAEEAAAAEFASLYGPCECFTADGEYTGLCAKHPEEAS